MRPIPLNAIAHRAYSFGPHDAVMQLHTLHMPQRGPGCPPQIYIHTNPENMYFNHLYINCCFVYRIQDVNKPHTIARCSNIS